MLNSPQPRSLPVHLYRLWRSLHDTLPPPSALRAMRREVRRLFAELAARVAMARGCLD